MKAKTNKENKSKKSDTLKKQTKKNRHETKKLHIRKQTNNKHGQRKNIL